MRAKKLAVITPHKKQNEGAIRQKLNKAIERAFAVDSDQRVEGYGIVVLKRDDKGSTFYDADWSITHSPYHHAELPEIVRARLQEKITKQVIATDG